MNSLDISINKILDSIESGILLLNENLHMVYQNHRVYEMLGLREGESLQPILTQIVETINLNNNNVKDSKGVHRLEINGKDFMVHLTKINSGDFKGTVINLNLIDSCRIIMNRLDNEMEVSSLLNIIMDATNDCFIYVNKDGTIAMLSKAYAEFLKVNREQAIGKHVRDVIENTRMDLVIESGKSEVAHMQKVHGRMMIATRIPIFVNGNVVGAVGKVLFRNVDELNDLYVKINKIEKELNLYKDEFKKTNEAKYSLESIITVNPAMNHLKDLTVKIANTNSNVLILGDSGTGKELFAHAIHNNSKRKNNPFIKVNCGGIPHDLIESELFGYEEGSFTGAKKGGKIGKFKAADEGTIFLDEIAELDMNMQVKLLRVLQDREIEKIGSTVPEKIDVRVIAATNKDLEQMVEKGTFRLDLYYRLNVINLNIPPLKERKEDIIILSSYLVEKISKFENIRVDGISPKALEFLKKYDWPGNVRELENILERAINFIGDDTTILTSHLPPKITGIESFDNVSSLKEIVEDIEKEALINSIIVSRGNKTEAAKSLQISRTSLYEKLLKYGIEL